MIEFFNYLKKIFGMDEKPRRNTAPVEPQPTVENDTYVAQIYAEPIIEEPEVEQHFQSQREDAKIVAPVSKVVESIEPQEDISEFIIHKRNATESIPSEHENNAKAIKGDNVNVMGLLCSLADMIVEYDSYLLRIQDSEVRQIIELFQHRIIESLYANGVEKIKNEKVFNCLEHVTIPFSITSDGMPIREVKREGLVLGERVLLKAQVIV